MSELILFFVIYLFFFAENAPASALSTSTGRSTNSTEDENTGKKNFDFLSNFKELKIDPKNEIPLVVRGCLLDFTFASEKHKIPLIGAKLENLASRLQFCHFVIHFHPRHPHIKLNHYVMGSCHLSFTLLQTHIIIFGFPGGEAMFILLNHR